MKDRHVPTDDRRGVATTRSAATLMVGANRPKLRDQLVASVEGPVITAADAGYEKARGGFDLSQLHQPTMIVEASNAADVTASLGFAQRHDLPVAVQATGHGTSGALRNGLLISTRRLTSVTVDPSRLTARVQAGATWTDVLAATSPHGLAPLCGSAPAVGAVGYLLGGGLGPLGRRYGFGADHVASIDAATVGGESITISADSEPDLFWGMRGAGTNFAVVTEVEIGLQPVSWVYGGGLFFPGESAGDVLHALVETVRDIPDALSLSVAFIRFPPNPILPRPLQGQSVCHVRVCHVGSAQEAEPHLTKLRVCAPLLLDTVAELPFDKIGTVHGDPVVPAPVNCRSQVLKKFDVDVAALLVGVLDDQPPYLIELRHLGGALALDPTPDNAVGHRDGVVNLFTSTYPRTPSGSGGPSQDDLIQALSPYSNGGAMVNFLQGSHVTEADVRRAYERDSWPRLTALKTTWDPENRLRSTKNIAAYPSTDAGGAG